MDALNVVAGEECFLNTSMYSFYFVVISPWKRAGPFIWKKNGIPFTDGWFVPSLVEIGPKFGWNWPSISWEESFLKCCQCNFFILQLSPFGKGNGPLFEQTWIPFTQEFFVLSQVKIGPVVLEKKTKIGKVHKQTDRQTDDGRQAIRKAHLSFQLRLSKNRATKFNWHSLLSDKKLSKYGC